MTSMDVTRRPEPPSAHENVVPVVAGTPVRTEAYLFEQLAVTVGEGRAKTRFVGDADTLYRLAFEIEKQVARHMPGRGH